MLKVIQDEDVVMTQLLYGQSVKTPRKRTDCPHCKAEIAFYAYSPLTCPVCKAGLTDIDKLMKDKPYGRIAFHQGRFV